MNRNYDLLHTGNLSFSSPPKSSGVLPPVPLGKLKPPQDIPEHNHIHPSHRYSQFDSQVHPRIDEPGTVGMNCYKKLHHSFLHLTQTFQNHFGAQGNLFPSWDHHLPVWKTSDQQTGGSQQ